MTNVSVCLSARKSQEPYVRTSSNFLDLEEFCHGRPVKVKCGQQSRRRTVAGAVDRAVSSTVLYRGALLTAPDATSDSRRPSMVYKLSMPVCANN